MNDGSARGPPAVVGAPPTTPNVDAVPLPESLQGVDRVGRSPEDFVHPGGKRRVLIPTRERGHPVGLSSRFCDQLKALRDDEGARSILKLNSRLLTLIEVDDPGVCRDIDTPEDLRRAR